MACDFPRRTFEPDANDLDAKACGTTAGRVANFKSRHGLARGDRLSAAACALLQRLDALESLRVLTHAPGIAALCKQVGSTADLSPPKGLRERAEEVIHRTGWAVRRGPCDPRSSRGGPAAGITTNGLYD
jgi:hypothetical protein